MTGETAGLGATGEPTEEKVCALLAHFITSESLFLTKIHAPYIRQLTLGRNPTGILNKNLIFNEICDTGGSQGVIDRNSLNIYLQSSGYCFPAHLTEAFFRRFNPNQPASATQPSLTNEDFITREMFEMVLFELPG